MKKTILMLTLGLLIIHCSAQSTESAFTKQHEITGGVGLVSDAQVLSVLGDLFASALTAGYVIEPGTYNVLSPNLNYRYWLSDRFALGASYTFDYNTVRVRHDNTPNVAANWKDHSRLFHTFAIEGVYNYVSKPSWQFYGMLGAGVTIVHISDVPVETWVGPNFQLSPFGMRFGKDIGGFFELGYGYKGILNAGISYRF
ncbi:MAG: hypothetical protein LBN18_04345 [Dysgonamonadaceae bacterium]|jgi:hypothetical protein|nr:hypothetical protein [Dysgonamonadaceae bacterium]